MNAASLRILASLAIGLLIGAGLAAFAPDLAPRVVAVAQPVGKVWLDALTMTVTPLVFTLIVTGIAGAARADAMAGRAFAWFAGLLVAACVASAAAATLLLSIWPPGALLATSQVAGAAPPSAGAGWLSGFAPINPIKAAAETAIVPLVIFALLFGFAARRIEPRLRDSLITFMRAVVEAMLVIVRWVLWLGPIGVGALAIAVGVQLGAGAFAALLHYVVVVSAVCLLITLLAYPTVVLLGRMSIIAFARACLPAQAIALSTQSSLATMPAMVAANVPLGVRKETAGLVLPLAVSVFRAASAAANVAVAIYLAHAHGVQLGVATLAVAALVGAVVSLAAVGVPAQVSFFATIVPVCLAIGAPITLLPLLLAVESGPDLFRTLGNVTVDLAVTRIVGRRDDAEDPADPA